MDNACPAGEACAAAWLPEPPGEPHAEDCCGSGCTPCVYDIYEQEMQLWHKECDRLRAGKHAEDWTVVQVSDNCR